MRREEAVLPVRRVVILPKDFRHPFLNDSKQLSERQRNELRPIIERHAICFGVGIIDNYKIDANILQATYLAMHQAIDHLNSAPYLLIRMVTVSSHIQEPNTKQSLKAMENIWKSQQLPF